MKKKAFALAIIVLAGVLVLANHFLLPKEAVGQMGQQVLMIPRE